jgi:hypothetical protein
MVARRENPKRVLALDGRIGTGCWASRIETYYGLAKSSERWVCAPIRVESAAGRSPLAIVVIGGALAIMVLTRVLQPVLIYLCHRRLRLRESQGVRCSPDLGAQVIQWATPRPPWTTGLKNHAARCRVGSQRLCEGLFRVLDEGPTAVKDSISRSRVYEVLRAGPLRTHFQLAARRGLKPPVTSMRSGVPDRRRALAPETEHSLARLRPVAGRYRTARLRSAGGSGTCPFSKAAKRAPDAPSDRGWHFRDVRRAGGARGSSATIPARWGNGVLQPIPRHTTTMPIAYHVIRFGSPKGSASFTSHTA